MTSFTLLHSETVCPHCQAVNVISATDLAESVPVNCSKCHQPIALWGEISSDPEIQPET